MSLTNYIANLGQDMKNKAMATDNGLVIQKICWEDTARDKDSCWGPNISDMTLCVDGTPMPIIRHPNFTDKTCDYSIDKFYTTVGNEIGIQLRQIQLQEYLKNIGRYTDHKVENMYLERDQNILVSTQACILPLKDGKVDFNIKIHNYQYSKDDPAVLVLVVSDQGTSAQVLTERNQTLYFNKNGRAADFNAKRITQYREEMGIDQNAKLSVEEKEKNVLFVYQIPLKQTKSKESYQFGGSYETLCCDTFGSSFNEGCGPPQYRSFDMQAKGMEFGILDIGDSHSKFEGTKNLKLVRDERFPIRCTIQSYFVTDTHDIKVDMFKIITMKLNKVYEKAKTKGSLVIEDTDRPTKMKIDRDPDYDIDEF